MKYKFILILIFFGFSNFSGFSQNTEISMQSERLFKRNIKRANLLMQKNNFFSAEKHLIQSYNINPNDENLNFDLGVCKFFLHKDSFGLNFFRKINNKKNQNNIDYKFYLARSLQLNYKFKDAQKKYIELNKLVSDSDEFIKKLEIEKYLQECRSGIDLMKKTNGKIYVTALSDSINSAFDDFTPFYSENKKKLYFSSSRNNLAKTAKDEDIYFSAYKNNKFLPAKSIGKEINTSLNEAIVGISPEGDTIYIYSDTNNGDIYACYYDSGWSEPVLLPPVISGEYHESSLTFSNDGKTMYFISDRPGSIGGKDIFVSNLEADGKWGQAKNAGNILNTIYDEESPYISGDTLFFASKGHNSTGGFDIFSSLINPDGTFSEPVNLSFPVNSPSDDFCYMQTGKIKLFASDRLGTKGGLDIFSVHLKKNANKELENNTIAVENNITTDENNTIASENNTTTVERTAKKIYVIRDFTFAVNKFENKKALPILDTLTAFLKSNPQAVILVTGYTDTQGSLSYNNKLSKKRAEFVIKYIISQGVKEEQLKFNAKGEENQISKNKDKNGKYIYKSLHYNRRVEFTILKQGENSQIITQKIQVPEEYANENTSGKLSGQFSVWISCFSKKQKKFENNSQIFEIKSSDGNYDYYFGKYDSEKKAAKKLLEIKSKFPKAFVCILEQ